METLKLPINAINGKTINFEDMMSIPTSITSRVVEAETELALAA